jgi:hypothetical protein
MAFSSVAAFRRLPSAKMTLPLLMRLSTSVKPRSLSSLRSFAIGTWWPPTLMPRRNAM